MFGKKWTKNTIEKKLKTHVVNVKFTKRDGTPRTMRATLRDDLVPEYKGTSTRYPVQTAPDHVRVYDLDKQDWRSFTLDQINDKDASVEVE